MADVQPYRHDDIERYLQQQMTPQEMHAFEKTLMNDPFLADALEGFSASNPELTEKHLNEIERELKGEKQKVKVVAMPLQNRSWWKVAAVVLVIVTGGILSYSLLTKKGDEKNIAQKTVAKQATEMAAKTDSVGPAEKPLAKVEAFPGKELLKNKTNSSPIIIKPGVPATSKVNTLKPEEADTGYAATNMAGGRNAFMDTNANMDAASKASTSLTEEPEIQTKKIPASPALAENKFKARSPDATNKVALTQSAARSFSPKKTASNVLHVIEKKENSTEPIGGWENFEQYLNSQADSLKATASDSLNDKYIRLEFSINEEGRPENIEVQEKSQSISSEKVIQILTKGPKWKKIRKEEKAQFSIVFY